MEIDIVSRVGTSLWDGLSRHLVGSFTTMQQENGKWVTMPSEGVVKAAITEAQLDVSLNWQSPFESAGPESRAPMLMALLQSGQIQPLIDMAGAGANAILPSAMNVDGIGAKLSAIAGEFAGRTGITKLNSTQIFNGMPPVKIQLTALFRAWRNAADEVEKPFKQLMQWALPEELASSGGTLIERFANAMQTGDYVEALMPSKAPTVISFKYKNRTFAPMVIESIGMPLGSPIDKNSNFIELLVPITICSLTALDRKDWAQASPI